LRGRFLAGPYALSLMKHLIFDFDGTLADSLEVAVSTYHQLTGRSIPFTTVEFAALKKLPARKVAKALGIPFWKAPFLLYQGRKIMHQRINEIEIFADITDVLRELHARGYELRIVSSNSKENIEQFLERYNLTEFFVDITGNVGLFRKGSALKRVMRRAGIEKHEACYIGDEARDIEASRSAGIPVVSVTWGFNDKELLATAHPYEIADKPADLLHIFSKLS
jgi:phosphoglycolate phosphatase-like HAD superfamily hydrolase